MLPCGYQVQGASMYDDNTASLRTAGGQSPEPHDTRHWADAASRHHDSTARGGLLGNLTVSIGRHVKLTCKLEIERADALVPISAGAQAQPEFREELRNRLEQGTSETPHAERLGVPDASPRDLTAGSFRTERSTPRRPNPATVVFWEALDPIERDAFRSVAVSRTFAAGARLIQEGDLADHVIVILSGSTKICVQENGSERVLAVRGPGQLVGERGALQVSVRSASVVARETVRALVVRTADFAAFISAFPTVLAIVERQLYDRLTEQPADSLSAWRTVQHPQLLNGENCTIVFSDVVGFGARTRTDEDRRIIREALFDMTHTVLQGISAIASWDDRGDGLLVVIPPSVPTAKVVRQLHQELPTVLDEHNHAYHDPARIQLRVAVNVGPIASDIVGPSGEAIIDAARLVEAPLFKEAMRTSGADLGIIAHSFIYETVIRHGRDLTGYSKVQVDVKEFSMPAWMKIFETTASSEGDADPAVA
jgi:CRP-like cAMP-binding protein